jgi:hypothetical protein
LSHLCQNETKIASKKCASKACKPNSVSRQAGGDHSSSPGIAARVQRPTRESPAIGRPANRAPQTRCGAGRSSSPIWSCSVWGLPCHRHRCRRGALLPRAGRGPAWRDRTFSPLPCSVAAAYAAGEPLWQVAEKPRGSRDFTLPKPDVLNRRHSGMKPSL